MDKIKRMCVELIKRAENGYPYIPDLKGTEENKIKKLGLSDLIETTTFGDTWMLTQNLTREGKVILKKIRRIEAERDIRKIEAVLSNLVKNGLELESLKRFLLYASFPGYCKIEKEKVKEFKEEHRKVISKYGLKKFINIQKTHCPVDAFTFRHVFFSVKLTPLGESLKSVVNKKLAIARVKKFFENIKNMFFYEPPKTPQKPDKNLIKYKKWHSFD